MINQAVNKLIEEAGTSHLDIPVQIWTDDCGSYVIPSLAQYMSCCRSRGIGFSLLCQSEHQLREAYGASEAETIIQCMPISISVEKTRTVLYVSQHELTLCSLTYYR